jgi:hypothetical protein
MELRFETKVLRLLEGAVDMHIHSAPDVYPRIMNDMDLARQAQQMRMRAIVIKNHFAPTAGRAALVTQETGFPVFGGIALNLSVGGINRHAVDVALKMGAKVVWLPTLHSKKFIQNKSHVANLAGELAEDLQGLYLLDPEGALNPKLYEIFDLIAKRDAILATGHITIEEARASVKAAAARGVKKIVITHPLASFVNYSVAEMKEMLDLGATHMEHVFNDTTRQVGHPIPRKALFEGLKAVGSRYCIMSTDAGQWLNPVPAQQLGIYIKDMLGYGLSEVDVRIMVQDNPCKLLGL